MSKLVEYLTNSAKTQRDKLPGGEPEPTYKSGFDVGYALGKAHAYEDVLKRFGVAPQNKAEAQTQQATHKGQN